MVSLIKRNSCGKALEAARLARDMLGGKAGVSCYWQVCSPISEQDIELVFQPDDWNYMHVSHLFLLLQAMVSVTSIMWFVMWWTLRQWTPMRAPMTSMPSFLVGPLLDCKHSAEGLHTYNYIHTVMYWSYMLHDVYGDFERLYVPIMRIFIWKHCFVPRPPLWPGNETPTHAHPAGIHIKLILLVYCVQEQGRD